mmetsp:Transcript_19496/g.56700  ORF Transcript_19496/g.56700 Transcript_19496/m.56700 type:complete len:250 (-) Transcript_19496:440-1189(-)
MAVAAASGTASGLPNPETRRCSDAPGAVDGAVDVEHRLSSESDPEPPESEAPSSNSLAPGHCTVSASTLQQPGTASGSPIGRIRSSNNHVLASSAATTALLLACSSSNCPVKVLKPRSARSTNGLHSHSLAGSCCGTSVANGRARRSAMSWRSSLRERITPDVQAAARSSPKRQAADVTTSPSKNRTRPSTSASQPASSATSSESSISRRSASTSAKSGISPSGLNALLVPPSPSIFDAAMPASPAPQS